MKLFWRIAKYAYPYKLSIILNIVFNLLATVFSLVSIGFIIPILSLIFGDKPEVKEEPIYNGDLLDYAENLLDYQIGSRIDVMGQSDALMYVCFLVIGAFFLKNLFRYLAMFTIAYMRNAVIRDIRKELHSKILQLPIGYFNENSKGDVVSRMTADLKEIENGVLAAMESLFREPIMLVASLTWLVIMSPQLTLFVLVLLPIVSIVITQIGKSLKRSSKKAQNKVGEILAYTDENISGLKVIKAFNAEEQKEKSFNEANERYFKLMNRVLRKHDLASPISEIMGVSVMAAVIWYGGTLVLKDTGFTPEAFIAYVLFFYQLIPPSKSLSKVSYKVQRGNASSERVFEILDTENPIQNIEKPERIDDFTDAIRFENVNFSYADRAVLQDINLEVKKGSTIALVGQSGGGKTTLTSLVPRFYDINSGSLTIDGKEVKNVFLHDLRNLMGIVTQETLLFNESVAYNIALGAPKATMKDIVAAAKIANAHEFIVNLEDGYNTNIGDKGDKLSGGQKQRLSIARAVLANPPILILDEATSALDTESEKLVQDALFKLMKNRTSLVIAHRLSTIQHSDIILVLNEGRIAEQGTHQELLDKNGIYKKLVEMQSFA